MNKKKKGMSPLVGLAILFIFGILCIVIGLSSGSDEPAPATTQATTEAAAQTTTQATTQVTTEATTSVEDTYTMGQRNALGKARSYLQYAAFSADGLKKQLEFEGYDPADADFAVANCGADWNEQAVKKAQDYLRYSQFSQDGLIKQLEFEGFTADQAQYAVSQVYQ